MSKPLDGVRVLDLTRLLPGAYATLLLADLGAEVIKIEDPRGGDGLRHLPPLADGVNVYFDRLNRNKRSVTLDLRSPEATTVLDALAARSDVIVDSFRPSTARRLRVDAASVRARHPHLVCASIVGFGRSGPYVDRAAHDINYQALAGLLEAGRPSLPQLLVADVSSAMQAAIGILAALVLRGRTGVGGVVDVSIHEAALAWSMFPSTNDLSSACYALYETADGQWLALGALERKFWAGFCERIGREDLIPFQRAEGDERARVRREVSAIMRTRTRDEWLATFADADVCLTPVHSPQDVVVDPHVVARALTTPRGAPAPALGADTDAVLEAAGINLAERARLRTAGVI
ncbi:MAG: CoA transferase [Acidobacteria bacterium]|nr:CoA transferase [Acidobacteriota bacterium]